MEKINIHTTLEQYKRIVNGLNFLYINEDNGYKAAILKQMRDMVDDWDFDKEAK